MEDDDYSELRHLLKEAIRASNRTTHAVRSIARPVWVLILTVLLSLPWVVISIIAESVGPLILVAVALLIGTIASIVVLRDELAKSSIPDSLFPARPRGSSGRMAPSEGNAIPAFEPQFWSERNWKFATPLSGTSIEDYNTGYWMALNPDDREKVASTFRVLTQNERGLWHVAGQPDLLSLDESDVFEEWLDRVAPGPLAAWRKAGEPSFGSWSKGFFAKWLSGLEN